ncbi:MAG: hypothetical protein FWH37_07645 [Candidatus Bathyarchaeota archaeon]|nr:hypothetical protein [Candidatus Termiticorpusculum sp.]
MKFIRKILSSETDLSNFNCNIDDELGLNDFIHKDALTYQQEGMGVTHLFYDDDKIVGYVTLAMHSIKTDLSDLPIDARITHENQANTLTSNKNSQQTTNTKNTNKLYNPHPIKQIQATSISIYRAFVMIENKYFHLFQTC